MNKCLTKAGVASTLNRQSIKALSIKNYSSVLDVLGQLLKKKLSLYSKVESVDSYTALKCHLQSTSSNIRVSLNELPKDTISKDNRFNNIDEITYSEMLECRQNYQEGIFNDSVESHTCTEEVDCAECGGSGKCPECGGSKRVTCPVCGGSKECPECKGTGKYTCRHCEGSGECPNCDNGWITCEDCGGDGEAECWDCGGSGDCADCNGTGIYGTGYDRNGHPYDIKCKKCKGSGKCPTCHGGKKKFSCRTCHGKGGWSCSECGGTGECKRCDGRGWNDCRACNATGICGKCRGKGMIWCPSCQGTGNCITCIGTGLVACPRCLGSGVYQTFQSFNIRSNNKHMHHSTMNINSSELIGIEGDKQYDDVLYDLFRRKINVNHLDAVIESVGSNNPQKLREWIQLNKFIEFDSANTIATDDFLNVYLKVESIPVTRITLSSNKIIYHMYIVGKNNVIYYDTLPDFWNKAIGLIKFW